MCLICNIIDNNCDVPFRKLYSYEDFETEFLLETENFVVIADIGPVKEGHSLIIPKNHISALAKLTKSELIELRSLKESLKIRLNKIYGDVIFFEHGCERFSKFKTSCLEHAHLHVVPVSQSIKKDINFFIPLMNVKGLEDLQFLSNKCSYIYYEEQNGCAYYGKQTSIVESQFIRKIIAIKEQIKYWNWRDFVRFNQEETKLMISSFRLKLSTPSDKYNNSPNNG